MGLSIYFIDFGFSSNRPHLEEESNEVGIKRLKLGEANGIEKLYDLSDS